MAKKKTPSQPLYKQIKDVLRREIELQNIPPNTPFLSESEAMSRFDVSRVTIRQTFDLLEQEGYIYRIQGKGTFTGPYDIKPAATIAFLASCILYNGVESILLRSIEDYLNKQNINLLVCNHDNDLGNTKSYIKRLIRNKVDAVIYVCLLGQEMDEKNTQLIETLQCHNIPVIQVDRYVKPLKDSSYIVTPNNYEGAYALTRHLISLGHTRIGFCQGVHSTSSTDRLEGMKQCLKDHGLTHYPEYVKYILTDADDKIVAMQYGMMKEGPTAVFANCDDFAIRLIEAFADFNISVPQDIAVVGFDDYFILKPRFPVNLTTMKVPLWDEGRLAASIAVDLVRGTELKPTHVQVPCELVIRESCGVGVMNRPGSKTLARP